MSCSCSPRHRLQCGICGESHSTSYVGASWSGPQEPSCFDEHWESHRPAKRTLLQKIAQAFGPNYPRALAQKTGDVTRHLAYRRPLRRVVVRQTTDSIRKARAGR